MTAVGQGRRINNSVGMSGWRPQDRRGGLAIDADRHRAVDRHATHNARLVAEIVDRLVLRRAIVCQRHRTMSPGSLLLSG
jgi:hypothetical protein